jgi:hypothetical protein
MDNDNRLNYVTSEASCVIKEKRPITRHRVAMTCTTCRVRKLKCNRQSPCGSCMQRNESSTCHYDSRGHKDGRARGRQKVGLATTVGEKLEHLEAQIRHLMKPENIPSSQQTHIPLQVAPNTSSMDRSWSPDSFRAEENDLVYVGQTHWTTMLDDIKELKALLRPDKVALATTEPFQAHPKDYDVEMPSREYDILFGTSERMTLENILSEYLPLRSEIDLCILKYFRAKAIAGPFIHVGRLMRQYEEFWKCPSRASPLWVAILFEICHMSTKLCSDHLPNGLFAEQSLIAAARCLTVGQYYKPEPFALEALTLFIQCKCTQNLDPSREIGVLLGTVSQLAYIMGYHRDPDHLKNITLFEKEMRRRTWALVMQLDLLLSFQLGIPSNISALSWDTKLPGNYQDSDLIEDSLVLCEPRPNTEVTRTLFFIAKQKLMITFEKIMRNALAFDWNEGEVDLLDAEIRQVYQSLPSVILPRRSIRDSLADESFTIATRHCVGFIYQKSLCVLHRKFVTRGRKASIRTSTEAASAMIRTSHEMFAEFKPGGLLNNERWLFGSLMWNDFLLAIAVLCLVLVSKGREAAPMSDAEGSIELLQDAYAICTEHTGVSKGSQHACRLLEAVLSRAGVQLSEKELHVDPAIASMDTAGLSGSDIDQLMDSTLFDMGCLHPEARIPENHMDWNHPFSLAAGDNEWPYLQLPLDMLAAPYPWDTQ